MTEKERASPAREALNTLHNFIEKLTQFNENINTFPQKKKKNFNFGKCIDRENLPEALRAIKDPAGGELFK